MPVNQYAPFYLWNSVAGMPGMHSTALAVDPRTWELVRFTLWADAASGPGTHYEVLHLSAPGRPLSGPDGTGEYGRLADVLSPNRLRRVKKA